MSLLSAYKKGKKHAQVAALETLMCGACWSQSRIHSIHPEVTPLCPRCHQEPEEDLHAFWTCPANATLQDEEVINSQSLVSKALSASVDIPCLWLRGILPTSLVEVPTDDIPDTRFFVKELDVPEGATGLQECIMEMAVEEGTLVTPLLEDVE